MSDADSGVLDPAARAEIDAIRDNAAHAYHDPNSREFGAAKAHMRELYVRAYGTTPILDGVLQSGADGAPIQQATPEAPAPEEKTFLERVPGPDSSPPAGLAAVWHDGPTREMVTAFADLQMPPGELVQWLQFAGRTDPATIPQPEETEATLRQEWGGDFEAKVTAARLAVERLPPAFADFLDRTSLGDHPAVIRRMAALGAPLLKARGQINDILRNPAHPYHTPGHPRHAAARAEVRRLYVELYSDRPVE